MATDARLEPRQRPRRGDLAAPPERFEARVAADPLSVRILLYALLNRFGRLLGPANASAVELVLAEVLNNVVEHAYGPDQAGDIEIAVVLHPVSLECRIADWGRPFPDHTMRYRHLPDLEVALDRLPEGGWGWTLIQRCARDLVYRRLGDRNELSLVVPLASP